MSRKKESRNKEETLVPGKSLGAVVGSPKTIQIVGRPSGGVCDKFVKKKKINHEAH